MATLLDALLVKLGLRKEHSILMIGLDAAGKTSIIYKLQLGEVVTTIPTIGFVLETVHYKTIKFTAWDVGGCDKIRPLWFNYIQGADALIAVVDSNDRDRMEEAQKELHLLALDKDLPPGTPLLLYANKQDLSNAMRPDELRSCLRLNAFQDRPLHLQPSCALTGDGLLEGMEWLYQQLQRSQGEKKEAPKPGDPLAEDALRAKVENWLAEADDDDDAFLAGVEDCSGRQWDHYAHLRLAWLLLHRHGRRQGKDKLFPMIKNFIANSEVTHGKSGPGTTFHETMTYFWMHMVHYAMACTSDPAAQATFKPFLAANLHLADGGLFLRYYSRELMLKDPTARIQVVLPDLQQLPSIVPKPAAVV